MSQCQKQQFIIFATNFVSNPSKICGRVTHDILAHSTTMRVNRAIRKYVILGEKRLNSHNLAKINGEKLKDTGALTTKNSSQSDDSKNPTNKKILNQYEDILSDNPTNPTNKENSNQ